jgi:hypothetical protein
MAYIESGARIGRDNRAVGSPAGKENLVNQVYSPAPLRPRETGTYGAVKSVTGITRSSTTATVTCTAHGIAVGEKFRIIGAVQPQYNGGHPNLTCPVSARATRAIRHEGGLFAVAIHRSRPPFSFCPRFSCAATTQRQ